MDGIASSRHSKRCHGDDGDDNSSANGFISQEERGTAAAGNDCSVNRVEALTTHKHDEIEESSGKGQISVFGLLVHRVRKSLVTCRASAEAEEEEEVSSSSGMPMEISWPTNVRHVVHVTFDRFRGFLGLPVEFELEVPRRVPSASVTVFGVSAESMQCSYDSRGNSVPTILLLMQKRLYSLGGLMVEGIFRINAENSQEEHVRDQLNKGIVPHDIDPHCLAGLIKAWFRELPNGVLDSLTPEQVMQCNTEDDCLELVKVLPPTQAGLLDWAINLMADVVQQEQYNKMNARNIAMVFAPNMTQMADPLTALMFAVQVMNFLKTLISRNLRERKESEISHMLVATTCGDDDQRNGHDHSVLLGLDIGDDDGAVHNNESVTEECFPKFKNKDTAHENDSSSNGKKANILASSNSSSDYRKSRNSRELLKQYDPSTTPPPVGSHEAITNDSFRRNSMEIAIKTGENGIQRMIQESQELEKLKARVAVNHMSHHHHHHQIERKQGWW